MIRIFLTGYMGAGKTTLGKAFARELNVPFIDLDWYIEERFHKSIRELFAERGEASFRELERSMLHEVSEFEDVIVSTGGGTPCFFDNMDYMNRHGQTVFLDVHPDILFNRLRVATRQRPILQGKTDEELRSFIVEALDKRLLFIRRPVTVLMPEAGKQAPDSRVCAGVACSIECLIPCKRVFFTRKGRMFRIYMYFCTPFYKYKLLKTAE